MNLFWIYAKVKLRTNYNLFSVYSTFILGKNKPMPVVVEVEWEKIPKEECVKLIQSMPRRVSAALKAKGGYTKY